MTCVCVENLTFELSPSGGIEGFYCAIPRFEDVVKERSEKVLMSCRCKEEYKGELVRASTTVMETAMTNGRGSVSHMVSKRVNKPHS